MIESELSFSDQLDQNTNGLGSDWPRRLESGDYIVPCTKTVITRPQAIELIKMLKELNK